MENEIIDFYNLYLRSVFFNFVFYNSGCEIYERCGSHRMGCDELAYVAGEHWLWESKAVMILGIIKRVLSRPPFL